MSMIKSHVDKNLMLNSRDDLLVQTLSLYEDKMAPILIILQSQLYQMTLRCLNFPVMFDIFGCYVLETQRAGLL
jgi:hypothetical protein